MDLSHDEAQSLVSKAWDEELTDTESARLAAHLHHCAQCKEAARRMRAFLTLIEEIRDWKPPATRSDEE